MQKEKLTLETLGHLDDGTVGAVVDAAIAEILKDCDDRPGLDKARKVTLEVAFVPVVDERTFALKGVDVSAQVKLSVPAQTMREQYLRTSRDTALNKLDALLPSEFQDGIDFSNADDGESN